MKIHLRMAGKLAPYFTSERHQYQNYLAQQDFTKAWHHLERAHIIGQAFPVPHTQVHCLMLLFGLRTRNFPEIAGQMVRLVLCFIGSFVGKYPVGNTGGANVPMLQHMPIPDDLVIILNQHA